MIHKTDCMIRVVQTHWCFYTDRGYRRTASIAFSLCTKIVQRHDDLASAKGECWCSFSSARSGHCDIATVTIVSVWEDGSTSSFLLVNWQANGLFTTSATVLVFVKSIFQAKKLKNFSEPLTSYRDCLPSFCAFNTTMFYFFFCICYIVL